MAYSTVAVTAGSGTTCETILRGSDHIFVKAIVWDVGDGTEVSPSLNTGAMDAGTLRVTLATDSDGQVKLAAGTAEIGKLAAGTAAIGKLAANTGVDIGDVTINGPLGGGAESGAVLVTLANDSTGVVTVDNTVLSVVGGGTEATAQRVTIANDSTGVITVDGTVTADAGIGTFAVSNTGLTALEATIYAEDQASGAGDQGQAILAVRQDTGATLVTADLDYTMLQTTTSGNLRTAIAEIEGPIGGGTEAAALRVTVANNSTGVLTVDDGGNALTVDAANDASLYAVIGDGSNSATIRDLAANDALNVAIVDGSGDQITSFGGGTQYTDDTSTHLSGTTIVTGMGAVAVPDDAALDANDIGMPAMSLDRRLYVDADITTDTLDGLEVTSSAHDEFSCNATVQMENVDVTSGAPLHVEIGDGTLQATVRDTGATDSLNVAITDASGGHITSFGGGTQYAEDDGHTTGDTGTMALAVQQTADSSFVDTNLDYAPLQLDDSGFLKVNVKAGGGAGGTSSTFGAAVPGTGTAAGFTDGTNMEMALVDAQGHLQVDVLSGASGGTPNAVDANNSSTSTLLANNDFTGTSTDALLYQAVTVMVDSDQDSDPDGLVIQFSTDGTNWDDQYSWTYTAGNARRFQFPVTGRYLRVTYANGGTGQGHFRLQTILHGGNVITSIHRMKDDISDDRSATVVKSALFAQASGTGDFKAVDTDASSGLMVGGSIAHDTVDNGNPVKIGGRAHTTLPSAVANNDRVNASFTDQGGLVVAGAFGTTPTNLLCTASGELAVDITSSTLAGLEVESSAHDDFLCNANLQVANADVSATNHVFVELTDGTNAELGVTANPMVVDTELPAAAALTDDFANPTAPAVGAFGMMYDGSTWDLMRGDSAGGLLVNLGSQNDVRNMDGSGVAITSTLIGADQSLDVNVANTADIPVSNTGLTDLAAAINANRMDVNIAADASGGVEVVQDTAADLNCTVTGSVTADLGSNNDVTVQGEDAENANITANPVLGGGRFDTAARTALGNTDVGAFAVNAQAALHTVPTVSQAVYKGVAYDIEYKAQTFTATSTAMLASPGASRHYIVLEAQVHNADAAERVAHFESSTTEISCKFSMAADGGGGIVGPTFVTADNEALNFEVNATPTLVSAMIAYIDVLT